MTSSPDSLPTHDITAAGRAQAPAWDCPPAVRQIHVGTVPIGGGLEPAVIAGPCVIESPEHCLALAAKLAQMAARLGIRLIFKASFDKANRTSTRSYRGPGMAAGLEVLAEVRRSTGLPILTDIHDIAQVAPVAEVVDILQIPAFLCRQTDLVVEAGRSGKAVNVKKGQFLAPEDMVNVVEKLTSAGCSNILLTDRGTSFGYHMLVSDFRALPAMRATGWPVCFDATHSVQMPGGLGHATGGRRDLVPVLSRAAAAVGIDALFLETHENPDAALSDGPNTWPLGDLEALLTRVLAIHRAAWPATA